MKPEAKGAIVTLYGCALYGCALLPVGRDDEKRVEAVKKTKLFGAVAALMVCLVLLISASYAWFMISTAPEIAGIDTQIGANGSLEVALLSDETYRNPSTIRTSVGDSLVLQNTVESNLTWGNVVDLSDPSYGLNTISILPARLNVGSGGEGRDVVNTSMLAIADYGLDGRASILSAETVSAVYGGADFTYSSQSNSYGVRGIGTISNLSSQQSALANARSLVRSYTSAAASSTESVWRANGASLLDILQRRYQKGSNSYTNTDVAVLRDTARRMQSALSYIDLALRQGIIGYGAAEIEDLEEFKTLRSTVENTVIPLTAIVEMLPEGKLPSGFAKWINIVDSDKLAMQKVIYACDELEEWESHTWEEIAPVIAELFDTSHLWLNGALVTTGGAYEKMGASSVLTIGVKAGPMANVADFTGNYTALFDYGENCAVEVRTASTQDPAYLVEVADRLDECEAASGDSSVVESKLNDVYGYAVDMAFRCNKQSDLLLQTAGADRVKDGVELSQTQGGGSYMRFCSDQLSTEQIVLMMDAIRIGFLDNQNNLLGVAKLNTSNYVESDEGVTASIYLYDYTVSVDGSISMGARRDDQSPIAELPEDTPVVLAAVVWLDGDHVDNSLAAISARSMTGVLNLQFASSATLHSADLTVERGEDSGNTDGDESAGGGESSEGEEIPDGDENTDGEG